MNHESNNLIEEARLLLPWYITGNLSKQEQALVSKALEASSELRKEFAQEEQMINLVKENTSLLELSALDTTGQRLDKMLSRIERDEQVQVSNTPVQQPSPKQKQSWLGSLFGRKLFGLDWLTPANAVFASLLALNIGVLGFTQLNQETYSTVTAGESGLPFNGQEKSRFWIEFNADAQYGEVCEFLNDWGARIVSGPVNQNMFVMEINTDSSVDADKFVNNIMAAVNEENLPVIFVGSHADNIEQNSGQQ